MLTRFHKILLGALALQIVLTFVMYLRGGDDGPQPEVPLVAGFDAAAVTRVQVFGPGATAPSVDLVKQGPGWVVASSFNYPADTTKVTDALGPIAKLAAAAPIATSPSRHAQLRVADAEFERKLVITAGGKDTTLYIGGAAGSRRTAVRLGADPRVFAVAGLNAYGFASEARGWVDTKYVDIAKDDVARVEVQRGDALVTFERAAPAAAPAAGSGSAAPAVPPPSEPAWTVAIAGAPVTAAPGESVDVATIERLVGDATSIDLTHPADPKRDASKPTATISIERKATGATTPAPEVIDVILDGDRYWVHRRGDGRAAFADKTQLDELLGATREKLVKKDAPPADPGAGAMQPGMEIPPGIQMPQ